MLKSKLARRGIPWTARILLVAAWGIGTVAVTAASQFSGSGDPAVHEASLLAQPGGGQQQEDDDHGNPTEGPVLARPATGSRSLVPSGRAGSQQANADASPVLTGEDAEGSVPVEDTSTEKRVVNEGRFAMPLAAWSVVTDRFGAPRGYGYTHGGIDLALGGLEASPIYASCAGTVSVSEYSSSYGYYAVVDCGEGWSTLYAHMRRTDVGVGASVDQQSVLGITGSSGFSTGEHLHFEIWYLGVRVNPEHYLDFKIPPGTPLSSGPIIWYGNNGGSSGSSGTGSGTGSTGGSSEPAIPPTETPSPTVTPTPTNTPTPTPWFAPSATPVPPTATPTYIPTATPTLSPTPRPPTPTPTPLPVIY